MRGGARAALLCAAAAPLLSSCASKTTGRLRENAQITRTDGQKSVNLNHNLEFGAEETLTPEVEVRFSERLSRIDTRTSGRGGARSDSSTLFHEPSFEVQLRKPNFLGSFGARLTDVDFRQTGSVDNRFQRLQVHSTMEYSPFELPTVRLDLSQDKSTDDLNVDNADSLLRLQSQYAYERSSAYYRFELGDFDDHAGEVSRDRMENLVRLDTAHDLFGDRVLLSANYFFDQNDQTESRGGAGGQPPRLRPARGLSAVDDTPLFGALTENNALIDGDRATGAGINIGGTGSGGGLFRNIGADLSVAQPVRELWVTTDVVVGPSAVTQFRWSVFVSEDNFTWREVERSAAFTYSVVFRRFEIRFSAPAARFLKVVNVGFAPSEPAVLVTEIELFGPGGRRGDQDFRDRVQTGSILLSWKLLEPVTLSYDLLVGRADQRSEDAVTRDESRIQNGLSLNVTPAPEASLTLRAQENRIRDPAVVDQDQTFFSLLLDTRPLEPLNLSFSASRQDRREEGEFDSRSDVYLLHGAAPLTERISASLDLSRTRQIDADLGTESVRHRVLASIFNELSRLLTLEVRSQIDFLRILEGEREFVEPETRLLGGELVYRPTPQFNASARVDGRVSGEERGLLQRYRADWLPFAGGPLDIQVDYALESGGVTEAVTDFASFRIRWNIRGASYLEINYTSSRLKSGGDRAKVDTFFVTLNIGF